MKSYLELKAKAEELMREANMLRDKERAAVIEQIKSQMAAYEIDVSDLAERRTRQPRLSQPKTGRKVPAKYGDGKGNLWSGRGLKPKWLKEAMSNGKQLADFQL